MPFAVVQEPQRHSFHYRTTRRRKRISRTVDGGQRRFSSTIQSGSVSAGEVTFAGQITVLKLSDQVQLVQIGLGQQLRQNAAVTQVDFVSEGPNLYVDVYLKDFSQPNRFWVYEVERAFLSAFPEVQIELTIHKA